MFLDPVSVSPAIDLCDEIAPEHMLVVIVVSVLVPVIIVLGGALSCVVLYWCYSKKRGKKSNATVVPATSNYTTDHKNEIKVNPFISPEYDL